ncbi:MAG: hypothetical protein IJ301_05565 [Clostridia bacterium]|nr:hypothetical protein [Clostridia bacterium]
MLKYKDKFTIATTILGATLLTIALACTLVFAAFTSNKQATTTIQFHEGVEMTVTGIDNSGKWIYNTTGATTGFASTSPTTAALDGLALSPITASVTKGAKAATPIYVRVFAVVTSSVAEGTAALPTPTLGANMTSTSLLTGETSFINSAMLTQKKYVAGTTSVTSSASISLLNVYQLFQANSATNAFHGSTLKAYVRIYASTNNTDWGTGYTFSF